MPEPTPEADDAAVRGDPLSPADPLGKDLSWAEQRAEIAEEPGGHGRFAFGCAVAVALVLGGFYVLRLLVLR